MLTCWIDVFNQITTQQTYSIETVHDRHKVGGALELIKAHQFFLAAPQQVNMIAVTHRQLWLVDIHVVHEVELCHKVLGPIPGSVDVHFHSVLYFSVDPTEGSREVSALLQNIGYIF